MTRHHDLHQNLWEFIAILQFANLICKIWFANLICKLQATQNSWWTIYVLPWRGTSDEGLWMTFLVTLCADDIELIQQKMLAVYGVKVALPSMGRLPSTSHPFKCYYDADNFSSAWRVCWRESLSRFLWWHLAVHHVSPILSLYHSFFLVFLVLKFDFWQALYLDDFDCFL